jgi:alpha-L-rhamnosidase
MNSHNHPMLGSVGAWLYRHVAGIQLAEDACGCDHFRVRPPAVPGLQQAAVCLDTIHGEISYAWEQQNGRYTVQLTVPVGASVRVELPLTPGEARELTESGQPLALAEGISDLQSVGGVVSFTTGSGAYTIAG